MSVTSVRTAQLLRSQSLEAQRSPQGASNIVVAVDNSGDLKALQWACTLYRPNEVVLHVVHVAKVISPQDEVFHGALASSQADLPTLPLQVTCQVIRRHAPGKWLGVQACHRQRAPEPEVQSFLMRHAVAGNHCARWCGQASWAHPCASTSPPWRRPRRPSTP